MMVEYRSNPDKPVSSSNTGQSPTRFTEGVEGRITDFDEKPIAGAFIQPRSLDEPKNPIPELAAFSNNDGWYRWPLRSGKYEITVSAKGYHPISKPVSVLPGQVTRLDFAIKRIP
jgi:hypothetical protein